MTSGYRARLFNGKPQRMPVGQFGLGGRFIDLCGVDLVGLDSDLPQKIEAAGRGRGEDQMSGHCSGLLANTARNVRALICSGK